MEARERWQALQAHLTAARQALSQGDKTRAADEVKAALAIDPEFAAARALQDRLEQPEPIVPPPAAPILTFPESQEVMSVGRPRPIAAPRPLVSAEGFARFEERARRRRIERRAQAARAAIDDRRFRDARAAIDEIRLLDPAAPEITSLAAAVAAARRVRKPRVKRWQIGPYVAAAAAFATIVLAASWVEQPRSLLSYPISIISALVSTAEPAPLNATAVTPAPVAEGTSGEAIDTSPRPSSSVSVMLSTPPLRPPAAATVAEIAAPTSVPPPTVSQPAPSSNPPPQSAAVSTPITMSGPPAQPLAQMPPVVPAVMPPQPVASTAPEESSIVETRVPDDSLVRRTLIQYKNAYEALDARSAQAVWPVVNERALARAFDGLESQRLVFDSCDVQVNGDSAAATCRGTARYIAKVGSREPRTEPRIWNFTLRRRGADWKIESARAER